MLVILCAGASIAFVGAALYVALGDVPTVVEQYKKANPGKDGEVCWPGETPVIATRAKLLLSAVARSWPSAIVAMPSLRNATGVRRQVKFALHEAAVANLFGQDGGEERFRDSLLLFSWAEWNPDLHATINLSSSSPQEAADLYTEQMWLENKSILPQMTLQAGAMMSIAKTRYDCTFSTHQN